MLTFLQLLKLSEDDITSTSQYIRRSASPRLWSAMPCKGHWKLEWLGRTLNAEGDVTVDDVDTPPA